MSAEWINVWEEKLYKHLGAGGRSATADCSGRGHIPGRVDITQRPQIVEDKRRVGDLRSSALDFGVRGGRASKFILHPVSSRSAGEV